MKRRVVTIGQSPQGYYFFGIQPPMQWKELKQIPNPASKEVGSCLTAHSVVHDSRDLQVIGFDENVPANNEQAQDFARSLAKSIGAQALMQIRPISHEKELYRE